MSLRVYKASEALASVEQDGSKVLNIQKKKEDKVFKGTRFLYANFNIAGDTKKDGWFSFENVELSTGMADPADETDKRNEFEGTRLQLQTSVSRAGVIGEFLQQLQPAWEETVANSVDAGDIVKGTRRVHGIVQSKLSEENAENPGGDIEDPIIRFKIDFRPYPARYPRTFLRGQPKTKIYDYRTAYTDDKGTTQYHLAKVEDPDTGELVDVTTDNIHLFVTAGSVIKSGRITMPSVAVSQAWISLPITINRAVIEPGAEAGFSDEVPVARHNALLAELAAPVAVPVAEQAVEEPTEEPTEDTTLDAVNALLDGL